MENEPLIHPIYEQSTHTWTFIISDPKTNQAVILDPVLDFTKTNNSIATSAADNLLELVRKQNYTIDRILETHGSSPARSAAWYMRTQLQQRTGTAPHVVMGKSFAGVQKLFARKYNIQNISGRRNLETAFADGQRLEIGQLQAYALHLPTPSQEGHLGYLIGRNVFIGEPGLVAEYDSRKVDFGSEAAHLLWISMQRLLSLPEDFRVFSSFDSDEKDEGMGRAFMTVAELRARCKLPTTQ
ncbi:hypothetical protein LTR62_001093 [Meristemomyces frigidus]|uniref:Metallo-beta-lactamase domain-containing protein n=1 Tax=Meristemomyces frigidus TaxID=1508187 RepID=A0AAN7T9I9_9PEZI|nr:hypothetical protein LTR62_001093 [Meristemomyces frigidus]